MTKRLVSRKVSEAPPGSDMLMASQCGHGTVPVFASAMVVHDEAKTKPKDVADRHRRPLLCRGGYRYYVERV